MRALFKRGTLLALIASPAACFSPGAAYRPFDNALSHMLPSEVRVVQQCSAANCNSATRSLAVVAVAQTPFMNDDDQQLDVSAVGRYMIAILLQVFFVSTLFGFVDAIVHVPGNHPDNLLPWQAVTAIFATLSWQSSIFNPMASLPVSFRGEATREDDLKLKAYLDAGKTTKKALLEAASVRRLVTDSTMDRPILQSILSNHLETSLARETPDDPLPDGTAVSQRTDSSWHVPSQVSGLVWLGIVAPLRAYSSALVYEASTGRLNEGHLNDPVLLWLVVHLAVADTWGVIENDEQRVGASVPAALLTLLTTLFVAKQYYDVVPIAGELLGLSSVWIAILGAVTFNAWRTSCELTGETLLPRKMRGYLSCSRLSVEDFPGI